MGRNLAKVGNNSKYPARSTLDGFSAGVITSASDAAPVEQAAPFEPASMPLPDPPEQVSGSAPLDVGDSIGF